MPRRAAFVAAIALPLVIPFTSWWMIGDLSCDCPGRTSRDYMFEPPSLSSTQTALIGAAATAMTVAALATLGWSLRRHAVNFADVRFTLPLVVAGVYVGLALRVTTAGVIGANIGGGMMILAAPVVAAPLVVWTVVWRPRRRSSARTSSVP